MAKRVHTIFETGVDREVSAKSREKIHEGERGEERTEDALASGGDEGRGKLR